jgi:hypothetical protein
MDMHSNQTTPKPAGYFREAVIPFWEKLYAQNMAESILFQIMGKTIGKRILAETGKLQRDGAWRYRDTCGYEFYSSI